MTESKKVYNVADLHPKRLDVAGTFTCDRCQREKTSKNVIIIGPLGQDSNGPARLLCNGCYGAVLAASRS